MAKILKNVSLAQYTSFKVGGNAQTLIELEPQDNLSDVAIAYSRKGPVWVLGWGTNCLISDKGLPGTVILNRTGAIKKLSPTRFSVDSGTNWDEFIRELIKNNLWGLEFTSGIPGGTGAAVVGNIAAYGHKVADYF